MRKLHEFYHQNKLIIILMIVFFFIRLPLLDQLNLLHDEIDISLSGYSIARTGKDLSGNFLPLSVKNIAPDNPIVSIYYSALWWLIIPLKSVFNARLPYVIVSTFLLPLIYSLIMFFTKNRRLAIVTAIVCCFSPWIFHITRLGMDVTLAFVTLLTAIILQLKRKNTVAYIFYILSFYNYQGFRILIPFVIIYLCLFTESRKTILKAICVHGIFLLLIFSSILLIDKDVAQNRANQVIFLNKSFFNNQIIFNRNTSLALPYVKSIFDNKITAPINYVLSSFIKGQDLTYLFKDGDYSAINGSISGGQFFLPFIVFYYLGFFAIGKKIEKKTFFVLGFIPLGMLASLVSLNGISFGIRGILSSIGYSFIIANGIIFGYESVSKQNKGRIYYGAILVFVLSLLVSVTYFSYTFFVRRPILVGEMFNEHERKISQLLIKNSSEYSQKIYTNNKGNIYRSYLFFNNTQNNIVPDFFDCKRYNGPEKSNRITIISSECISDKQYQILAGNPLIKKIWFSDYSDKIAYFIFE